MNAHNTHNPQMKSAEITVLKDIANRSIYNSALVFFGINEEQIVDADNDTILISFEDDGIPFDAKYKYTDLKYNFKGDYSKHRMPGATSLFEIQKPSQQTQSDTFVVINESRESNPEIFHHNLADIASTYGKRYIVSPFNVMFHQSTYGDVLYVMRTESTRSKPKYLVVYDDTRLTKEEVIYLTRNYFLILYGTEPN
jgi:hypothetical protein